ncbi:MAG TPA: sulfotransferase [Anaerolineales bacterium]|nr:sulfotransferase [Anaerolineales bacterium]
MTGQKKTSIGFQVGIKKYLRYLFPNDAFAARQTQNEITDQAVRVSRAIRGGDRPPAIIIHGIMKRSGTVFAGELLGLHPLIHPHPNKIWEAPFLSLVGDIRNMQENFHLAYRMNRGKIGENDFLPLFGSAFIAYLYSLVPEGDRMLLKVPGVEYLDYFYDVFPGEHILVLTRDGRDLVTSTIRTWPQLRFSAVCRRWAHSARAVLRFHELHKNKAGYRLARFEDAVQDPETFVREACTRFDLDVGQYPFERIASLPVIGSSTTRKQGKTWIRRTEQFNPIGRWEEWSAWQKLVFKRIAGRELLALGYCEDLNW